MRIILILACCLWATYSYAQDKEPMRYRIIEKCVVYKDKSQEFSSISEWKECNILLVIKKNPTLLTIYGDKIEKYDIAKGLQDYKNDEGDKTYRFQGVDANGISCIIRVLLFKEASGKHIGTCYIDYDNGTYVYRLAYAE